MDINKVFGRATDNSTNVQLDILRGVAICLYCSPCYITEIRGLLAACIEYLHFLVRRASTYSCTERFFWSADLLLKELHDKENSRYAAFSYAADSKSISLHCLYRVCFSFADCCQRLSFKESLWALPNFLHVQITWVRRVNTHGVWPSRNTFSLRCISCFCINCPSEIQKSHLSRATVISVSCLFYACFLVIRILLSSIL